jgi:hypothetical protein
MTTELVVVPNERRPMLHAASAERISERSGQNEKHESEHG